jgi:2-hydroxy-6-oxonona-2,4-dienedioate hydrolase
MGGAKVNPQVMERLKKTTTAASLENDLELTRSRLRLLWAEWDEEFGDELAEARYAIYHRPEFQKNLPNLLAL